MKDYNGTQITEEFYGFFAPYFVNLISHISDPREADNRDYQDLYKQPTHPVLGLSRTSVGLAAQLPEFGAIELTTVRVTSD